MQKEYEAMTLSKAVLSHNRKKKKSQKYLLTDISCLDKCTELLRHLLSQQST